ncbi:hypothetical protein M569_03565, partial [Genlisea aurea]
GIPIQHVKTLAKFRSRYNHIRVLEVSRAADHALAGSRVLLLDSPGNIHSISYRFKSLTDSYYDVFATLPPILPPGPIAILGFGAGSAARIILEFYSDAVVHGWEIDPSVLSVAREYFGLREMERKYGGRLLVHGGDALKSGARDGFAGMLIDLFAAGRVIPELQDAATWRKLRKSLRRGGRMMANVGGGCETLRAMSEAFPGEISVLSMSDRKDDSAVALAGELPEIGRWKKALRGPLKFYADLWKPYQNQS